MSRYEFQWKEPGKDDKGTDCRRTHRSFRDPTADRAIGRMMREERRKEQKEQQMRENEVEKAFVDAVREAGGMALKFTSQTMNGVPDRLILFKIGKCAFVELKAPGKQMRPLQRKRRYQLEALGFPVFCIDRLEQIQPVIKALEDWQPGEQIPTGVGARIPEIVVKSLPGEAGFASGEDVVL